MKLKLLFYLFAIFFFSLTFVNAISIKSVESDTLYPSKTSSIIVKIENDDSDTIEDIRLALDFTNMPFSSIGSSEKRIEDLDEEDEGKFTYTIRAASDAKPGEYKVPYILTYSGLEIPRKGTFGIKISGDTIISNTIFVENPIIGQKTRMTIKLINKGEGEARFVSLRFVPDGYTLLSESDNYIGSIAADDFESVNLDIIPNSKNSNLVAFLEYRDLDNNPYTQTLSSPLEFYTREEAIKAGLISKNNSVLYALIVIGLILIWLIYRIIAKKRRLKRKLENT